MTATYRRIVLASRPKGRVSPTTSGSRGPGAGARPGSGPGAESLPVARPLYARPNGGVPVVRTATEIDETMLGATAGVVEASNHPKFAAGDTVVGFFGWQEYGLSDGANLKKVDAGVVPMSAYLGPVGMPGITAWYGLNRICEPKAGETVLVSAASGAVGSVVGQLAKTAGCRAIGIAGGPAKCEYVVSELGFDACLDHRQHTDVKSMARALREVARMGSTVCSKTSAVCASTPRWPA